MKKDNRLDRKFPATTSRKRMWAGNFSFLLWLPSLSLGEDIPMTFLLFVALVMFVQKGANNTEATLYATMLLLPWLLKTQVKLLTGRLQRSKYGIVGAELISALIFYIISQNYCTLSLTHLTLLLMSLSATALVHHTFSTAYRKNTPEQTHLVQVKHTLSILQHAIVLPVSGVLLIVVGALQIYYRQFSIAWIMVHRACSWLMLTSAIYHILVLRSTKVPVVPSTPQSKKRLWDAYLKRFLLLLPQSFIFYTQLLFLLNDKDTGGLGSTLQEIGFAQGTAGMLAFIMGFSIFHKASDHLSTPRLDCVAELALGLSPLVFLMFSMRPPTFLWQLSVGLFLAQLFFGFGLGAINHSLPRQNKKGYHILYTPETIVAMCIPMACSGFLSERCGYPLFFLLCTASALLFWGMRLCRLLLNVRKAT